METSHASHFAQQRGAYFKTGTIGLHPIRTAHALRELEDLERGSLRWYAHWQQEIEQVRHHYADLIGAQPHEILLAPSRAVALRCIIAALDLRERKRVLLCDLDVPTLGLLWNGGTLVQIPSPDRIHVPVERFVAAMDETTALLAISRVQPASGAVVDVAPLAHAAHERGALLLVDDSYAAGYLPIDVKKTDIDVLLADTRRWLMGDPGLTLLYVREGVLPRLSALHCAAYGVYKTNPTAGAKLAPMLEYQRINQIAPALEPLIATRMGLELLDMIGIQQVCTQLQAQTTTIVDALQAQGWDLHTADEPSERGALILIRTDQADTLCEALEARGILTGWRPGFLEISPALHTTDKDIEHLLTAFAGVGSGR